MELLKILNILSFKIKNYKFISGGDINQTYYLDTDQGKMFLKYNLKSHYPNLFQCEYNGLKVIEESQTFKIPTIIECSEEDHLQFLILKWIEKGTPQEKTWEIFGSNLAKMHSIPQPYYGFTEDNYLGTLVQKNPQCISWKDLYSNFRILPLAEKLFNDKKFNSKDLLSTEKFCNSINEIFPTENPSLLHGDLWSGNFIISNTQEIYFIDPAVYYGHREMDLGMSKLFGGFSPLFYESYNEVFPLENGWKARLPYTQLYPLMFHAYEFGGFYIDEVKNILKNFY